MTISHQRLVEYEDALSKSMLKYLLWCIWRLHGSTVSQHKSGWAGFISETGQVPKRLITIDYYPIINHPTTDNSTVQGVSQRYSPPLELNPKGLGKKQKYCYKLY